VRTTFGLCCSLYWRSLPVKQWWHPAQRLSGGVSVNDVGIHHAYTENGIENPVVPFPWPMGKEIGLHSLICCVDTPPWTNCSHQHKEVYLSSNSHYQCVWSWCTFWNMLEWSVESIVRCFVSCHAQACIFPFLMKTGSSPLLKGNWGPLPFALGPCTFLVLISLWTQWSFYPMTAA